MRIEGLEKLAGTYSYLRNFGDGHPVNDFTGPPSVVLGVPLTVVHINPSDDLQSFLVSNQHDFSLLGHSVFAGYPGHRLGFRGLWLMNPGVIWPLLMSKKYI